MRAALYLRVSSEEQARHGYGLAAQRDACRARAMLAGAQEIEEFTDEGVSASLLHRPGLDALRRAVREGRFDLVVILDPDRLARNLAHQLLLTEELERQGARLLFVHFEWQHTAEGRLFYSLRGAIAEYEREKIRLRTVSGKLAQARQGKVPSGTPPYGYRYDPARHSFQVVAEEAEVVRRVFAAYVYGEESPSAIARSLEAEGVPTRKGGPWRRQTVRQMLANPVYKGTFIWNRRDWSGVALNRFRAPADRLHPTPRPPEEWIEVPVPPIVPPDLWEAARCRRSAPRPAPPSPAYVYLLSGVLRCPCDLPMRGEHARTWGRRRRVYACRGADGCHRHVLAEPLEAAVWASLAPWLTEPAVLASLLYPPPTEADRRHDEQLLRRIAKARREVLSALAQGLVAAEEAEAVLFRLRRQEHLVAARLAAEGETADARLAATEALLRRYLPDLPRSLKRALVQDLVAEVRLRPGELTLVWRET